MGEKKLRLAAILFAFYVASITETYAEIYKHVDKNGRVTYSNKVVNGANKLSENSTLSTNNYPNVSTDVQAKRDLKRRQILENELSTEKKLYVNAKKNLINAQNNIKASRNNSKNSQVILLQYSKKTKDQKLLHERNITALRKELEN